ncbi:MAG: hypothetical protein Kow00114_17110 [Kiloniellaceae bacterium]
MRQPAQSAARQDNNNPRNPLGNQPAAGPAAASPTASVMPWSSPFGDPKKSLGAAAGERPYRPWA